MFKAPKSSHITPILRSLHWLKINERIEYELHSLTYKVLTTSQPTTYIILSLFSPQVELARSSSLVTLTRPPVSSSLEIANHSFMTPKSIESIDLRQIPINSIDRLDFGPSHDSARLSATAIDSIDLTDFILDFYVFA